MVNGPALAALNGDSVSSKPSSTDTSLSPPSTSADGPSELPASPPSRNGLDAPPAVVPDIDFEKETSVKYRRSSNVPDYRASMFAGKPLPNGNHVPVFAPTYNGNGISSGRNSIGNGYTNGVNGHVNGNDQTNGHMSETASPRPSDVSIRPTRRSISPVSARPQTMMAYPPGSTARTSGAVSPLTIRSVSPTGWRSGAVSPIAVRSSSPVAPIYRRSTFCNGITNGTSTPQHQSVQAQTLAQKKLAARHTMIGLTLDTLNTHRPVQQPKPEPQAPEEEEEAMDEVISLSPAVRAPISRFRRSSSGLSLNGALATPVGPVGRPESMTLDTVMERGGCGIEEKKYFGQDVNAEDLVAVGMENAFDRL